MYVLYPSLKYVCLYQVDVSLILRYGCSVTITTEKVVGLLLLTSATLSVCLAGSQLLVSVVLSKARTMTSGPC